MKTSNSVIKSFQALSIGVGGLLIVVAEASAAVSPVQPKASRSLPIRSESEQVAQPFDSEPEVPDLAACFHKPNRIGLSQVRDLLKE